MKLLEQIADLYRISQQLLEQIKSEIPETNATARTYSFKPQKYLPIDLHIIIENEPKPVSETRSSSTFEKIAIVSLVTFMFVAFPLSASIGLFASFVTLVLHNISRVENLIHNTVLEYNNFLQTGNKITIEKAKNNLIIVCNSFFFRNSILRKLVVSKETFAKIYLLHAECMKHTDIKNADTYYDIAFKHNTAPEIRTHILLTQIQMGQEKGNTQYVSEKIQQLANMSPEIGTQQINIFINYLKQIVELFYAGNIAAALAYCELIADSDEILVDTPTSTNKHIIKVIHQFSKCLCKFHVLQNNSRLTYQAQQTISTDLNKLLDAIIVVKKMTGSTNFSYLLAYLEEQTISALCEIYQVDGVDTKQKQSLIPIETLLNSPFIKNANISSSVDFLHKILGNESFARMQSTAQHNWLHFLPRIEFPKTELPLLEKAIQKLLSLGISPYARDDHSNTAFAYIPEQDPNNVLSLFTPGHFNEFFGAEEHIEFISNMLDNVENNPRTKNHLLLAYGPPGVGKTELSIKIAEYKGYEVIVYRRGDENDMYVGQLQTRIYQTFSDAVASGKKTVILVDEAEVVFSKDPHKTQHEVMAAATNEFQTEINKLIGTNVCVFALTNFKEKIKPAIIDRAGTYIRHFKLPNLETRLKIIQHRVRMWKLESNEIPELLARSTAGWSARKIDKFIDGILSGLNPNLPLSEENLLSSLNSNREHQEHEIPSVEIESCPIKTEGSLKNSGLARDVINTLKITKRFLTSSSVANLKIEQANFLFHGKNANSCIEVAKKHFGNTGTVYITLTGIQHTELSLIEYINECEKVVIFIENMERFEPNSINNFLKLCARRKNKENTLVVLAAYNGELSDNARHIYGPVFTDVPIKPFTDTQVQQQIKTQIGAVASQFLDEVDYKELTPACNTLSSAQIKAACNNAAFEKSFSRNDKPFNQLLKLHLARQQESNKQESPNNDDIHAQVENSIRRLGENVGMPRAKPLSTIKMKCREGL